MEYINFNGINIPELAVSIMISLVVTKTLDEEFLEVTSKVLRLQSILGYWLRNMCITYDH
jgi:hypothetical protein